jgi:hypothetical protein
MGLLEPLFAKRNVSRFGDRCRESLMESGLTTKGARGPGLGMSAWPRATVGADTREATSNASLGPGAARPHRAVSNAGGQSRPLRRRSGPDGSDDDAGWPRAFESRVEDSAGRDGVEHRHPARLVTVPPARGHMRAGWSRKRSSPQHPPMAGKGTWQASITFLGASQITADQARGPAIGRQPAGASARSFSSSESRR